MSVISILMVDDHPVVLEGYSRLLERQGGFRVCAQADNVARAYQLYKDRQPDVVIMDLALQGAGGLEAVRQIREWDQQARSLIFTMRLCAAFVLKAFEAGAVGYLTKSSEPGELVKAVAAVANGRRFLSGDTRSLVEFQNEGGELAVPKDAYAKSVVNIWLLGVSLFQRRSGSCRFAEMQISQPGAAPLRL